MADKTGIEWTDATWNPISGCTEVSLGCDHCYAKTFAERWRGTPGHYFERGFDVQLRTDKLDLPLRWQKPRRIFVNSMADLFHDAVPDDYIAHVFAVMSIAHQHTFQILTKRHARMRALLNSNEFRDQIGWHATGLHPYWTADDAGWPFPNVWLGVSAENQQWADIRIPALLDTPAAIRFVSTEPLLGPIDLFGDTENPGPAITRTGVQLHPSGPWGPAEYDYDDQIGIDWVIAGGESGRAARPMYPGWVRSLREQCAAAEVPFLFKQWGEWAPSLGRDVPQCFVWPDGTTSECPRPTAHFSYDSVPKRPSWCNVERVGKKAAGRELDGRTWDQYPETANA